MFCVLEEFSKNNNFFKKKKNWKITPGVNSINATSKDVQKILSFIKETFKKKKNSTTKRLK